MPPMRQCGSMRAGQSTAGRLQEGGACDNSCGDGAFGVTPLRREMNEPAFYFRAVLLQPFQEFCCCFIRVLVDWMNSVASLKVGYVVS